MRQIVQTLVCISGMSMFHGTVCGEPGQNLAAGMTYRWNIAPNSLNCTDLEDSWQLTDGIEKPGYLWMNKETVGWTTGGKVVDVVIDLEQSHLVAGVRIHTSARQASGAFLPKSVIVAVSDDGREFRVVKKKVVPDVTKAGYDISLTALHTSGRYIMLRIEPRGRSMIHADEIQIFKGDSVALDADLSAEKIRFKQVNGSDKGSSLSQGKPYRWNAPPDRPETTDAEDSVQPTDGIIGAGRLRTRKETVGWKSGKTVDIVIDLKVVSSIDKVTINTNSRLKDEVYLPSRITIAISDDGKKFRMAGRRDDIPITSVPHITAKSQERSVLDLYAAGRYVMARIEPREGSFVHFDEINVYDGDYEVSDAKHTGETVAFHALN